MMSNPLPQPRAVKLKPGIFLAAIAIATIALFAALAPSAMAGGGISSDGSKTTESSSSGTKATTSRYDEMWDRVSRKNKRWASRTAMCESGKDPNAIGGGGTYRGAFQFMKSTWRTSPKSPGGDPIDYSYKTQAVVALLEGDGAGHWPVCG
jgi:hypothetical protein